MMFLGYYGTLVNFTKNPQDAKPDSPLFQLLKKTEDIELVIIKKH